MDDIEQILTSGESKREIRAIPSSAEISESEVLLSFRYPTDYLRFLQLGGLGELAIGHAVLSPREIASAWKKFSLGQYVPFADNQCGDYYCWRRGDPRSAEVYFLDHASGQEAEIVSKSFTEWLRGAKF